MTTTEATALLATFLGRDRDYALAQGLTGDQVEAAERAIMAAIRHGRDWSWHAAELALARAYSALGSVPPEGGTGYAWHCGQHPIQIALREVME